MSDQGRPLPKFGEWDVNDPASAEGFTVIFNKARDEKKTGGKSESVEKGDPHGKPVGNPRKPQSKDGFVAFTPRKRNLDEAPPPPPYVPKQNDELFSGI